MRVMQLVEAAQGGLRRHYVDLNQGLFEYRNIELHLVYSLERADSAFLKFIDSSNSVKKHEIPMKREIGFHDVLHLYEIVKYIKRNDIDIVHGHSSKAGMLGRIAATICGIKSVYTPNSSGFRLGRTYRLLEKLSNHISDTIVAVCNSERKELIEEGIFDEKKVLTINSAIPVVDFSRKINDSDTVLILSVGRLDFQKNPELFVEIAKLVVEQRPNVRFIWVGDGKLRDEVQRMISEYRIVHKVSITGWTEDVYSFYRDADIFLINSRYESFGYVTLEAMHHSLPTVASAVAGSVDLVSDNETGYLVFDIFAPQSYVDNLIKLIDDRALRKSFGDAAKRKAEIDFSLKEMIEETVKLYEGLIK